MASADDDRPRRSPAYKLIHHYRERALAAVDQYRDYSVDGQAPAEIRRDLAKAAINYYDVLYEFRDEDALVEDWAERGVDWLDGADERTVAVTRSLARANDATTEVEVPLLQAVDPRKVIQTIRELNDIAKELGFGARVDESTPRTDISKEDFQKVEEWRKQNLE